MGLLSVISGFFSLSNLQPETRADPIVDGSIEDFYTRLTGARTRPWRLPSITEALGVPAIQRAVTLIASTTGLMTVQGFRNGALMADTPRLLARPDPYQTPRDFYRDWAYLLATRGEAIHWIASRDFDSQPSALIAVPPAEAAVEDNPRNRLFPIVKWGKLESTWYSPANPTGQFVHTTYLREPGQLRGTGPLQLAKAAISVSVEAQEWAANFYAGGATSNVLIKHAAELSPIEDEDGYNEAARLKAQWMTADGNTPRVIDQNIESVDYLQPNPQGAQMLDAREHNNGDAARMFGIPGALVEYNAPGSSLTYQNIAEVYRLFLTSCLQPNYLEPIEQSLTDLLPRSQTARFYVEGILRADIKTRFDVYEKAITLGMLDAEGASRLEGWAPGSPEVVPVPAAPPAAVPASLPEVRTEVRCDGMHVKRVSGVPQLKRCNRLLSTTGRFEGACPRCKKQYEPQPRTVATDPPAIVLAPAPRPVAPPVAEPANDPAAEFVDAVRDLGDAVRALRAPSDHSIQYHVGGGAAIGPGVVNVPAPIVNVTPPVVNVPETTVNVDTAPFVDALEALRDDLRTELRDATAPRIKHVDRDRNGRIVTIREEIA